MKRGSSLPLTQGARVAPHATQSDVALGVTQLTARSLVALIPGSKEDEYLGTDTIEIDCSGRGSHTTQAEKELLTNNGYKELFDHLVVGWDMWVKADQTDGNIFFSGVSLPTSHRGEHSTPKRSRITIVHH